ncbi:uncharacterized protein BJX67DRAFT_370607 [Aspergillus lucknowensis]|uniref:Subtelomeric hrmA-associated cluster protein AFUB-079030/YDR124W-like helical bundle domain-containing protein n=1 Tax=Aspergillus lucknowensis TaxID=176173 RepID=A0ABR4M034_9EURO
MDAPGDSMACPYFALLYIDDAGKLRFEASPSIAEECHSILSPDVTHSFLTAVAQSGDGTKPLGSSGPSLESHGRSPLPLGSPGTPSDGSRSSISHHVGNQIKRRRASHEYVVPMSITCYPKTVLSIGSQGLLRRYYAKAFDSLQQTNCRILAKAYIKLVEPRKQVNYPYNGRKIISGTPQQFDPEATKPSWWPAGVTHREPDHLRKPERIRLLVHILCDLRESHAVSVEKLKEADQSVRRQICPVERLQVLDEIYHVREEEEKFLDGKIDGRAAVCVSRVHLPDMTGAQASHQSPTGSKLRPDAIYNDEVPNLESHTSVFPSSSSPTSQVAAETTPSSFASLSSAQDMVSAVPTAWDTCTAAVPASLSGLNPTMIQPLRDGATTATPYPLDFSTPIYPHHDTTTLEMAPFAMDYYTNSQPYLTSHALQQSSRPLQGPPQPQAPGTSLENYPRPYYFTC